MNNLTTTVSGGGTVILEDGEPVQETKSYGIGIDCHSKFIQVCVLTKRGLKFYAHQCEFGTDWDSLVSAKEWCAMVLAEKSSPPISTDGPIHYCIESTSTYHMPILLAFGGTPSIVNPTLAGATKRKTDVLDARLLATHDLVGVWRESYVPSTDIQELRVIIWERDRCISEAVTASRRINNAIVRFGYTLGRDGSVTLNDTVREIIEAIVNGDADLPGNLCPLGIPHDVREIIISEYEKHDRLRQLADKWRDRAEEKVLSMEWETGTGTLSGSEMLSLLMTAPQVGRLTAITWLVHIITPRRFPNAKAISEYHGLGKKFFTTLRIFMNEQNRYKQSYKKFISTNDESKETYENNEQELPEQPEQ